MYLVTKGAVTSNFSNRSEENGKQANFDEVLARVVLEGTVTLVFLMAVVVRKKVKDSLPTMDSLS